eukprot:CAMPEP_0197600084 /NCGR_PEP_ID=MMETSP1326-20131121/32618_1 /TAXON_ID=1155430 /ORGANISM="Genus nov. species nov., Strain RCC2288" /LENGTH=510 /DNA_ID=CAMNT_0043167139 /DNA_START=220 /DNA_END=1752 /DNA_ORIENTATION=-
MSPSPPRASSFLTTRGAGGRLCLVVLMLLASPVLFGARGAAGAETAGHADHADEHHDEEPPLEHLMEVYDGGDAALNATELGRLFASLQDKMSPEASAVVDDGHGHSAPAAATGVAITETLTMKHILEEYAGNNPKGLNESAFLAACPAMLLCASEASCEFEHEEEPAATSKGDGSSYIGLKLVCIVVVFLEGLFGGLAPIAIKRLAGADTILAYLNAFSGGVFLTAGVTHILPHVVEASQSVDHGDYPLPYALVMCGYLMVFLVERVLFHSHAHSLESEEEHEEHGHGHALAAVVAPGGHSHGSHAHGAVAVAQPAAATSSTAAAFKNVMVLLLAVSLHAVLAGVSLGVQSKRGNILVVLTAIAAHKAPEAFSIGSKLVRSGMGQLQVLTLVLLASLVTPLGIGIGVAVGTTSPISALVLEGLAAGTFIYIGATEIMSDEFETSSEKCEDPHKAVKSKNADEEQGSKQGGNHSHRVHSPPGRSKRLSLFTAYLFGCTIILLTNLTPHYD